MSLFRTFLTCLLLLPMTAVAEDLLLPSAVTDVTLYPNSAAITRQAAFDLQPGAHRLILADLPALPDPDTLRIAVDGVEVGPITYRSLDQLADLPERPDLAQARAAWHAAQDRLETAEQTVQEAQATAMAARLQLGFLNQLGQGEQATAAGAQALSQIAEMIARDGAAAQLRLDQAEARARRAKRDLALLRNAADRAAQRLDELTAQDSDRLAILVDVTADQATSGAVTLSYLMLGSAGWEPSYDARLTRGDPARVDLGRSVLVWQNTGARWRDVRLTLSTQEPARRLAPRAPFDRRQRIAEPQPEGAYAALAEPVVEPAMVNDMAQRRKSALPQQGLAISYVYPDPVDLGSGVDTTLLALQPVPLAATARAVAVPSRDTTAFLVAELINDSGERILPAPTTLMFVEGAFVGNSPMPDLPAGETADLGFGPLQDLQLRQIRVETGQGDTGLFAKSNEQRRHRQLEIRNLSTTRTWAVQVLDSVPYSEQDDLVIEVTAEPAPNDRTHEDRRGVWAWDLTLAPGETRVIDLRTTLRWPEGMELR